MRDGYERGGLYLLYSCVGIRAGRFVCFMLTLEAAMCGEVYPVTLVLDDERAES